MSKWLRYVSLPDGCVSNQRPTTVIYRRIVMSKFYPTHFVVRVRISGKEIPHPYCLS